VKLEWGDPVYEHFDQKPDGKMSGSCKTGMSGGWWGGGGGGGGGGSRRIVNHPDTKKGSWGVVGGAESTCGGGFGVLTFLTSTKYEYGPPPLATLLPCRSRFLFLFLCIIVPNCCVSERSYGDNLNHARSLFASKEKGKHEKIKGEPCREERGGSVKSVEKCGG